MVSPRFFQRIHGLGTVKVVRRLDNCELARPSFFMRSSTVFNSKRSRVCDTYESLYPRKKAPRSLIGRAMHRAMGELTDYTMLRNSLRKAESGYFLQTRNTINRLNEQGVPDPKMRVIGGYTMEANTLETRQEFLAVFADIDPTDVTQDLRFTQTDMLKFVDMHELQHARSCQLWAYDPKFFSADKNLSLCARTLRIEPFGRKHLPTKKAMKNTPDTCKKSFQTLLAR